MPRAAVTSTPARILLADDHAVVRQGLRALIEREDDLRVVAECDNGIAAVDAAVRGELDLAILDVAMPGLTGLQAARQITRRRKLPVLMLSMYDREQYFFEAIAAGAAGYVLKRQVDRDIIYACRAALRGDPFIYPEALATLMQRYLALESSGQAPLSALLTPRETEVVKLIAEGHHSREIAQLLMISVKTVDRHRTNIMEKLQVSDRVHLTRYAIRTGLVEP